MGEFTADQLRLVRSLRLKLRTLVSSSHLLSHPLNRHHQAITTPSYRLDVMRNLRRVFQRQPQLPNRDVDAVVKFHDRVVWTEPFPNLLARHHLLRALEQHSQNLEGLFLQADSAVPFVQFSRLELQPEGPETDGVRRWRGVHRMAIWLLMGGVYHLGHQNSKAVQSAQPTLQAPQTRT